MKRDLLIFCYWYIVYPLTDLYSGFEAVPATTKQINEMNRKLGIDLVVKSFKELLVRLVTSPYPTSIPYLNEGKFQHVTEH